jgi:hypothetical protein
MAGINKAGDILSSIFRDDFDPDTLNNARLTAGLFSSWEIAAKEANIPAASDHSRIRDYEHGVLLIEAEHPGWIQLLQTKQGFLLNSFQKKFPQLNIQGISFCLSKMLISRPSVNAGSDKIQFEKTKADSDNSGVDNETLHESIAKFRSIILKKNRKTP